MQAGEPQHVAWAYDRPDGGRGFGFTGYHRHDNLCDKSFRSVLANGAAWVTGLEIPETGVGTRPQGADQLATPIGEAKTAIASGK